MFEALSKLSGPEAKTLTIYIVDKIFVLFLVSLLLRYCLGPLSALLREFGGFARYAMDRVFQHSAESGGFSRNLANFDDRKKTESSGKNGQNPQN